MIAKSSGISWIAGLTTCALTAVMLGSPSQMPDSLRRGVYSAVDGAARACLWMWNEPYNAWDTQEVAQPVTAPEDDAPAGGTQPDGAIV